MPKNLTRGRSRKEGERPDGTPLNEPVDVGGVLDELGERASYVTCWRIAQGKEYHLFRVPAAEFSVDAVQKHPYGGGGDYRARIAGPRDGRGKSQWLRVVTFSIAGPPNDGGKVAGASDAPTVKETPVWQQIILATAPAVVAGLVTVMTREKQTDPLLVSLLDKLGNRREGLGPEVLTLIESARAAGIELGTRLGAAEADKPVPSEDGPLTTTLKEGFALVKTAMQQKTDKATAPRAPTAAARLVPGNGAPAVPAWIGEVRKYLPVVLLWPDQGKTPEVKAYNLLDDLSDSMREELAAHCESDTFVRDVFGYLPELRETEKRSEWFTRFLVTIQNELAPETEEGETDDGANADAAEASRNDSGGDSPEAGTGAASGGPEPGNAARDMGRDAGPGGGGVAGPTPGGGAVPGGGADGPAGPGGDGAPRSGRGTRRGRKR